VRTSARVREEAEEDRDEEEELVPLLRCSENLYRRCFGGRADASAYDFAASAKELVPLLIAFVLLPAATETGFSRPQRGSTLVWLMSAVGEQHEPACIETARGKGTHWSTSSYV